MPSRSDQMNSTTCLDETKRTCMNGCKQQAWLQKGIRAARAAQLDANEPPEVFKVVTLPTDALSFGEGWHTDLTFYKRPPTTAVLIGRDVPTGLGATTFFSTADCYDSLPTQTKEAIEELWSVHTDKVGNQAFHPLVKRTADGRRVLYVNRQMTRRIVDPPYIKDPYDEDDKPDQESARDEALEVTRAALLKKLFNHIGVCGQAKSALRLDWQSQDLVLWDEVATQHSAVHDYVGHRREMHRVLISGLHYN